VISLFFVPYSTIYVYAFFSPEFSGEFQAFPGLQKIKEAINITPTADEETLLYNH